MVESLRLFGTIFDMAESRPCWVRLFSVAALAFAATALCPPLAYAADGLADPTKPPASLATAETDQGSASSGASSMPKLQSVLLSPERKIAVISGQPMRLGEKFGAAVLVKITETEVVLRTGSELQTLKLFPDVEKRVNIASKPPSKHAIKPTVKPKASARGKKVKEQ